ncbi:hypothetical protein SDC9_118013 [bioreactor metagenome]|uniref:Multidrug resistance protein MdtA-like C-terminal permuted SH3 domain-containing protein n=1 Tax=bioreactor metagenome TaxID=1076179 RepID=A0A645BZV3_9ZZZZ
MKKYIILMILTAAACSGLIAARATVSNAEYKLASYVNMTVDLSFAGKAGDDVIRAQVSYDVAKLLETGKKVVVMADVKQYGAYISYMSNTYKNGTCMLEFGYDGGITPGMVVEINAVAYVEDILAIPKACITYEDDGAWVTVLQDGHNIKRYIKCGIADGKYVQVVSGLSEGEAVLLPKQ